MHARSVPAATIDPERADELLEQELSDAVYRQFEPSLLQRLWTRFSEWLTELVDGLGAGSPAAWVSAVLAVLLVAGAVALAAWVVGPIRRRRRLREEVSVVADRRATGEDLLADALHREASGDLRGAVLVGMRSLVRNLEERTLLEAAEGMTAHEVAERAAVLFPQLRGVLDGAATDFDRAAYSMAPTPAAAAQRTTQLARYLRTLEPRLDAAPYPEPAA